MCGVVAALPTSQVIPPPPERAQLSADLVAPLTPHPPLLAERPPKLIA